MAKRNLKEMNINSLKSVVEKSALEAIYDRKLQSMEDGLVQKVLLPMDKLIEHPDNEFLFGSLNEADLSVLGEKMKKHGFRGAIGVWDLKDGTYMIYDGHRRKRRWHLNGNNDIPCEIYELPEKETDRKRELLAMNVGIRGTIVGILQNPFLVAKCVKYMKEILETEGYEGTMKENLGREFGIDPSSAWRYFKLNDCVPEVEDAIQYTKDGIKYGWLQLGQACSLANLSADRQQIILKALESLKVEVDGETLTRTSVQEVINLMKEDERGEKQLTSSLDIVNAFRSTREQSQKEDSRENIQPKLQVVYAGDSEKDETSKSDEEGCYIIEDRNDGAKEEDKISVPDVTIYTDKEEVEKEQEEQEERYDLPDTKTFDEVVVESLKEEESLDEKELSTRGNCKRVMDSILEIEDALGKKLDYGKQKDIIVKRLTDLQINLKKALEEMGE